MKKDNFIRYLRKEYLLFKKERSERHREFCVAIKSVLKESDFFIVDSEALQALHLKVMCQGVGSPININFNKCQHCEIDCSTFPILSDGKVFNMNDGDWLCVIPSEWQLYGGFLVLKEVFFSNLLKLSFFMQDDFDVYDSSLDNVLIFRGNRSCEGIVHYDVTAKGDYFSFFLEVKRGQ